MITYKSGREIILKNTKILEKEKVKILDAENRVLQEDIYSPFNIPPYNNSAMDGYAVKFINTKGASRKKPILLKVLEDVPAGKVSKNKIGNFEAIRIMTGAPIPKGADAVIPVEDTERDNHNVKIFREIKKFENIRFSGEDVKKNELILKKGKQLKEQDIGMFASIGRDKVYVIRKPKVGIISTGDELLEPNNKLKPGKIYNSNAYFLYSQTKNCGAIPIYYGIVKDEKEILRKKIEKIINEVDVLILSGGVSVGDYDEVKNVIKEVGRIEFSSVAQRPGKPLVFGKIKNKLVFGLPGNPVSSFISFIQYVKPCLLKMQGKSEEKILLKVKAGEDIKKKKGFRYFLRGILKKENNKLYVKTTGPQGSGILKSLVIANCLIVLDEEIENLKKGEEVEVEIL